MKKQHKKPCDECPFGRIAKVKTLGGSAPEVYIGQLQGPFWLPCHKDEDYADKESDPTMVSQCAGASIFRSNLGLDKRMPPALNICDADAELSFTSFEEFVKHHTGREVSYSPEELLMFFEAALFNIDVKVQAVERPNED